MKRLPPLKSPKSQSKPSAHQPVSQNDRQPFGCVLYGESGIGKTSFAAEFENAAFIVDPHERGIIDLVENKQCPEPLQINEVNGWLMLLQTCDDVASDRDVKTVVFDSLTGMEQLCFMYHCKTYYNDDWSAKGFYSYMQGPKNAAKRDWPDLISKWEDLRANGKNVIVIGHSHIKPFSNPDGPDYDKYLPYLDKETWAITHVWAPMVLFYKFQVDLKKDGAKHKAEQNTEKRIICTSPSSTYAAKNRHNLPPVIVAGSSNREAYEAFIKAYERGC